MKNTFVSKNDLAQAYFPYIGEQAARHKLIMLIEDNTILMQKLGETGYKRCSHSFSPVQVQMVMDTLGNPFK